MINSKHNYDGKFYSWSNCFKPLTHKIWLYFSFNSDFNLFLPFAKQRNSPEVPAPLKIRYQICR